MYFALSAWVNSVYLWLLGCKEPKDKKELEPLRQFDAREKIFDENDLDRLNNIFHYGKKKQ